MFDLCVILGRTVAELESTLSSSELTEWFAYAEIIEQEKNQ